MTTSKRACGDCEYYGVGFDASSAGSCQRNPPTVTSEYSGKFPKVAKQDWCGKWEPRFKNNPVIADAWKEFQVIYKLAGEPHD